MITEGLVVGAVTGLVGSGGGFLVVPALALLGGLPMSVAVDPPRMHPRQAPGNRPYPS